MRHATATTVALLEPWLVQLRSIDDLRETRPGVFYVRSRAFLHFHEGDGVVVADVRFGGEFERVDVTTRAQRDQLVTRVKGHFLAE